MCSECPMHPIPQGHPRGVSTAWVPRALPPTLLLPLSLQLALPLCNVHLVLTAGCGPNRTWKKRHRLKRRTSCVALGESPSLSVHLLPHLKSRAYRLDCRLWID